MKRIRGWLCAGLLCLGAASCGWAATASAVVENVAGAAEFAQASQVEDERAAATWLERAAEKGHSEAAELLGERYFEGRGVARDYSLAAYWLRRAAMGGRARAQYRMGRIYLMGIYGVPRNEQLAQMWLERASRQGVAEARELLLRMADAQRPSASSDEGSLQSALRELGSPQPKQVSEHGRSSGQ